MNLKLFFDESGNLGKDGRYFIIGCLEATNHVAVRKTAKRVIGKVKSKLKLSKDYELKGSYKS